MAGVFVLQHVHTRDDDTEDVKFIGVYSTRENAQAAIARLSAAPGFSETPNGFHIDEYQVDKDQWTAGYVALAFASSAYNTPGLADSRPS